MEYLPRIADDELKLRLEAFGAVPEMVWKDDNR